MCAWKPMKDISRVLRVARQLSRAVSCPLVLSMPSIALQRRLCRKLLWSRACGGYLKSETQLAQEGKVLVLYLIFSALEWGLEVGVAPPPTFSQVSFLFFSNGYWVSL